MTTDDLAGYFRCLCDPACSTQPWPMDFSHSNRCTEANANTRRPDGLASLLAIHGSWRWTCDSAGFDTRDYGILCDCGKFIEASQETDDGARLRHGEHVAAVIAAAGWIKAREEWKVSLEHGGSVILPDENMARAWLATHSSNGPMYRRMAGKTEWKETTCDSRDLG